MWDCFLGQECVCACVYNVAENNMARCQFQKPVQNARCRFPFQCKVLLSVAA